MLSTVTTVGSIGLLANASPVLATLEPTELRIYRSEGDIVRFAQAEGYLQMAENRALVLVEQAVEPSKLDRAELEAQLERSRAAAESAPADSEELARARRDTRRAEAFLKVVSES